jgi:uncharacterized protein (TIGR01777 family)
MNIAMSGATGFIGTHLTKVFAEKGWQVIHLGRTDFELDQAFLLEKMGKADAVINLAGASIAERWTEEYKKVMYASRVDTTKKIVNALGKMEKKPEVFISASAVGIYKPGGPYTEEDEDFAEDFLGRLAFDWEQAALGSKATGTRTVVFRFGVVLGKGGGALEKMIVPFSLGLGGVIGDGKQPFSWVHVDDLVRAHVSALEDKSFGGVYNLTAPDPTTNEGLTKALGHALNRPTFMRIPEFVLRLQLGEGAEVLLKGQKVLPKRLLDKGFTFKIKDIEQAVKDVVETDK